MSNTTNRALAWFSRTLFRRYWAGIIAVAVSVGAFLTYYIEIRTNARIFLCDTIDRLVELEMCGVKELTLQEMVERIKILDELEDTGGLSQERRTELRELKDELFKQAINQIAVQSGADSQRDEQAQRDLQVATREIVDKGDDEEREAIALIAAGDVEGALHIFHRLAQTSTADSANRWRHLGRLAYDIDSNLATKAYETLITFDTFEVWDAIYLSRLYSRVGKLNLSKDSAYKALARAGGKNNRDKMVALGRLGDLQVPLGDLDGALESYRSGMEIAEALASSDPSNAGWQRDLSVSHNKIGDVQRTQGDLDAALESYRSGMKIAEALASSDPSNAGWQRDLSVSHNKIGDVQRTQGDLDAALESYRSDMEIAEALASSDPSNAGWQRDLSVSHKKIGDVQRTQGDLDAALESYRSGMEIAEALASSDPSNAGWQRDLSVSHKKILITLETKWHLV